MTLREHMAQARRTYLLDLWERTGGSATKAAPLAGVERTRVYMLWAEIGRAKFPPSHAARGKRFAVPPAARSVACPSERMLVGGAAI